MIQRAIQEFGKNGDDVYTHEVKAGYATLALAAKITENSPASQTLTGESGQITRPFGALCQYEEGVFKSLLDGVREVVHAGISRRIHTPLSRVCGEEGKYQLLDVAEC